MPPAASGESGADSPTVRADRKKKRRWALCNPEPVFARCAPAVRKLRPLLPILIGALLVGAPLGLYLFFAHPASFRRDLHHYRGHVPYLTILLINLLTVNLLRCVVQGLVCAAYNVPVPEFGIRMRFGVLPRFYIDKSRVENIARSSRLWIYATSPLLRLALIAIGFPLWAQFRGSDSLLSIIGAWTGHAGLMGLLFVTIPLWQSDGYNWLAAYLNLHPRFRQHSIRTLYHSVSRRPRLPEVPPDRHGHYLVFGLVFAVAWTVLLFKAGSAVVRGLEQSFPTLFGYSTHWLFFCLVAGWIGTWVVSRLREAANRTTVE